MVMNPILVRFLATRRVVDELKAVVLTDGAVSGAASPAPSRASSGSAPAGGEAGRRRECVLLEAAAELYGAAENDARELSVGSTLFLGWGKKAPLPHEGKSTQTGTASRVAPITPALRRSRPGEWLLLLTRLPARLIVAAGLLAVLGTLLRGRDFPLRAPKGGTVRSIREPCFLTPPVAGRVGTPCARPLS